MRFRLAFQVIGDKVKETSCISKNTIDLNLIFSLKEDKLGLKFVDKLKDH